MKSRLFKKFFLTTAGIFLAGLTFLSSILAIVVANYLVTEIRDDLEGNCSAVVEVYDSGTVDVVLALDVIKALAKTSDAEIYIVDTDGIIEACSCDICSGGGRCEMSMMVIPSTVIEKASKGEFFENGTLDGFFGKTPFFTVSMPLYDANDALIGFVMSSSPTSQINSFFSTLLRMYLLAAIIPTVLIFFAEYALSYRFMRPIKQMSVAAKRMAKGDFSRRIPVVSDDEIGDLSISFNNMTNSLAQLESMRRSFIANVSHELRTPMTTIGGFIDGILDGTIDKEMQPYYLNIVSQEVKRLSRLVESMLCLAKLESGEQKSNPQKINIAKMTRDILISQEKRLVDKNPEITGLDVEEITAYADYDLIYQVIFNLVDNALKFVNENGKIDFIIEDSGYGVNFKIRNTGSFIAKEELKYIFDRFYKVDKSRSDNKNGTGLGLYISKTIIEIHRGKIYADSLEGKYTEFGFSIPNNNISTEEN